MLDHFVLMTDGGSVFCVLRVPTWPRLPLSAAWHQHKADAVKLNSGAESPAGGPDISWAADACYCRRLRPVSPGPHSSSPQNLSVPTGTEFPDRFETFTGSERYKNRHLHFIICQINEGQKRGRGQISIGPSILVPGPLTLWKTWAQILRFQCQPFRKSDSISSRLCFFSSLQLPCCYFHSDEGKVKEN